MAERTKVDTIEIKGQVSSGSNEGADFIRLPWVKAQIAENLGFTPYDGTLNIRLDEKGIAAKRAVLAKAKFIKILPAEGYRSGLCVKAVFMDKLDCAIIIPEVSGYPENMIEIVAPVNLRNKFKLSDGDTVKVTVKSFDFTLTS